MKNVLVPIADGTEEMEVVIIVDILRRAGINVLLAGLSNFCVCSRGITIYPDKNLNDINDSEQYDMIVIPGGLNGVRNLSNSIKLRNIVRNNQYSKIASICAGPLILKDFGVIDIDNRITSHPSVAELLSSCKYENLNVVEDGRIITSRGAGTAIEFSLHLVKILCGQNIADKIATDIVFSGEINKNE